MGSDKSSVDLTNHHHARPASSPRHCTRTDSTFCSPTSTDVMNCFDIMHIRVTISASFHCAFFGRTLMTIPHKSMCFWNGFRNKVKYQNVLTMYLIFLEYGILCMMLSCVKKKRKQKQKQTNYTTATKLPLNWTHITLLCRIRIYLCLQDLYLYFWDLTIFLRIC